jgi:hypothetical protein
MRALCGLSDTCRQGQNCPEPQLAPTWAVGIINFIIAHRYGLQGG